MNIDYFMKEAIKEANNAFNNNEVPVGGILVDIKTNEIICRISDCKFSVFFAIFFADKYSIYNRWYCF